jgi:alcohol oxidase
VIEGGPDNYENPTVVTPAMFVANTIPGSKLALFYKANKAESTANREMVVPAGGVLGGGSSINYLTYSRAQKSDFDGWGLKGWTGDDMLHYVKKARPGSRSVCVDIFQSKD